MPAVSVARTLTMISLSVFGLIGGLSAVALKQIDTIFLNQRIHVKQYRPHNNSRYQKDRQCILRETSLIPQLGYNVHLILTAPEIASS